MQSHRVILLFHGDIKKYIQLFSQIHEMKGAVTPALKWQNKILMIERLLSVKVIVRHGLRHRHHETAPVLSHSTCVVCHQTTSKQHCHGSQHNRTKPCCFTVAGDVVL